MRTSNERASSSEAHHLSEELNPDLIDIKPLVTEFNAIDRVHGVMIEKDVAIVAGYFEHEHEHVDDSRRR